MNETRRLTMERMLVVVFDDEKSAGEGEEALRELQREGSIALYAGAMIVKHADGTASVEEHDDFGPVATLFGTSAGSLIGLLAGPGGIAVGAISGLALGGFFDLDDARVGQDFLDDVTRYLTPNKVAVVEEIDEEWTVPVDTRMEALGGKVFRRAMWEVRERLSDEEILALEADAAKLEEELSRVPAERRAKLEERIDILKAKIGAKRKMNEERREAFARRQKARREVLKKKAAAAGGAL